MNACSPRQPDDKIADEFVHRHPEGTIYHLSGWKRALLSSFPWLHWKGITIEDDDGELRGLLQLYRVRNFLTGSRLEAAPFASECGALAMGTQERHALLDCAINSLCTCGVRSLEIKHASEDEIAKAKGFVQVCRFKTHLVRLDRLKDIIWKSLDRSCIRQKIQRAQNSGLDVRDCDDEKALKNFYSVLLATREARGLLPIPFRFFQAMWKEWASTGRICIKVAYKNGRAIAGVLLLRWRDRVIAEYAGSDRRWLHLGASQLLLWSAIEEARNDGFSIFSFGRTAASNGGLLAYKRRWGTEERDLYYYYYPSESVTCRVSFEDGAIKKTVSSVLRLRLPRIIRNQLSNCAYRYFM